MIPTAKYRSPEQRESIIWLVSVKHKLVEYAEDWPSEKRRLILNEIVPAMDGWATELMEDIAPKEGRAIIQMARRVNPMLVAVDFAETDDQIMVDVDDHYALAELALEYCKFAAMAKKINKMTNAKVIKKYLKENFTCRECLDPDRCRAQGLFSKFLVPPLVLDGPCPYLREEEVTS